MIAPRLSLRRGTGAGLPAILGTMTLVWVLTAGSAWAADRPVLVFAAASLRTALTDVAADWEAATGTPVTLSFAGSSALARQIEAGAPADVFVSANVAWMDALAADGLIDPDTRRDVVTNRLVVIAHGDAAPDQSITALPDRLGDHRMAVALVDAVPAGQYARQALMALGVWDALADRLAQTDNVRAALALVARGETPYGIVYATDAAAEPQVTAVADVPTDSHAAIVYPAAVVADSAHPQAAAFVDHLVTASAGVRFLAHGFGLPE